MDCILLLRGLNHWSLGKYWQERMWYTASTLCLGVEI